MLRRQNVCGFVHYLRQVLFHNLRQVFLKKYCIKYSTIKKYSISYDITILQKELPKTVKSVKVSEVDCSQFK